MRQPGSRRRHGERERPPRPWPHSNEEIRSYGSGPALAPGRASRRLRLSLRSPAWSRSGSSCFSGPALEAGREPRASAQEGLGGSYADLKRRAAAIGEYREEGFDDFGVELCSGLGAELGDRCLFAERGASVCPRGCHRVEGIADSDDASTERDLVAGEAVGVALAVDPFVASAHDPRRG